MENRKKYTVGKCDYNGNGRFVNEAQVEWELRETEKGLCFSMSAGIWNSRHSDFKTCGQICEQLLEHFPNDKKLQRMIAIWREWHLNDLHAGCEHQRNLGWEKDGYEKHPSEACPVCGYKFGSDWQVVQLPQEVIDEIRSW